MTIRIDLPERIITDTEHLLHMCQRPHYNSKLVEYASSDAVLPSEAGQQICTMMNNLQGYLDGDDTSFETFMVSFDTLCSYTSRAIDELMSDNPAEVIWLPSDQTLSDQMIRAFTDSLN